MSRTPTDVREVAVLRFALRHFRATSPRRASSRPDSGVVEIRATDDGRKRFTAAFDAMSPVRGAIVAAVGELRRRPGRPA